jgi:cytochrome d ubiquinol oxidase subunit II
MLVVALIFVPVVLAYQAWVYRLFAGKVGQEETAY